MSSSSSPNRPAESSHPMRNSVRFPLQLPVRVETEGGAIDAVTKDISATGVLFMMPTAPAINTRLTWTLCLPADVMGGNEDVTVTCVGRVVWYGPTGEGQHVGVVIDGYRMGDKPHD
jgi:hypothetical protein